MITARKKKKLFLKTSGVDLNPRVLRKRKVQKNNKFDSFEFQKTYDVLEVEIACFIDQRVLLEEKIADIKVFLSNQPLERLGQRRNLIKEAALPGITPGKEDNDLFDRKSKRRRKRRESQEEKNERRIQEREEASRSSSRKIRSNIINVVYDIDNLNQNTSIEKFKSLKFLTKFDLNQHLKSAKIKNIQNIFQDDEELFGKKTLYKVRRVKSPRFRKLSRKTSRVSIVDSLRVQNDELPSDINFKSSYFKEISLGRDPLMSFQKSDSSATLEEKLRGNKKINEPINKIIREQFRQIAQDRVGSTSDEELGFSIVKTKSSNRNRIYKTTFEMPRSRIKRLSSTPGGMRLIYFAYDKAGRRVDSFEQKISATSLFLTETNPPLDFSMSTIRTGKGNIVTSISNKELQDVHFNLHQKTFSKTQNYLDAIFEDQEGRVLVKKNNRKRLVDGKEQRNSTPRYPKTKTAFQRLNPYFRGEEISNTIANSVPGRVNDSNQMSCIVYVSQEEDQKSLKVTISNVSEDVFAVLPVKRIARGYRGSDFQPLKTLVGNRLADVRKYFVRESDVGESEEISFSFTDNDVEDDVIYEYAAILYNKSGFRQISGNRFLEKIVDREGLIQAEINKVFTTESEFDEISGQVKRKVKFEVRLIREESDVDKIINSIFGDNRALFNDDLASIKDASNLIYGVRVHRVDTRTGENVYVGSFRGYKQEENTDTSSSDIPKVYRATFEDMAPAFSNQIYKFDPYIIPPSQVLDKVFSSLEKIVKSKNKSRTTLNKMLVSKQKLLNKDVLTKVGTKFASIQGRKGTISSSESFLEKNKNDLFLEGLTGDIVYEQVPPYIASKGGKKINLSNQSINLIKTLDRDADSKNYEPKKIAKIEFSITGSDVLTDFYVVLKQFNKDPNLIIDGAIHSLDVNSLGREETYYNYLSEIKTNIGLVRYYIFGISKNGTVSGPESLGALMLEGE